MKKSKNIVDVLHGSLNAEGMGGIGMSIFSLHFAAAAAYFFHLLSNVHRSSLKTFAAAAAAAGGARAR